jgi:hypothetical protein
METPVITIFVRHSKGCKYSGDEFCRRCNCRKHFRYGLLSCVQITACNHDGYGNGRVYGEDAFARGEYSS